MPVTPLSFKQQWLYAIGQLGWSTLINVINLWLVYFYIPSSDSGIPVYISQTTFLVVLNVLALLAAFGRIFDAFTDPIIAYKSDNYSHQKGRRLPYMKWGIIPASLACLLMFVPLSSGEATINIIWLFLLQLVFYVCLTIYVTPFNALIAEFGHNAKGRLDLSTYISITYALGIIIASQVSTLANALQSFGLSGDKVVALQMALAVVVIISIICMYVPIWFLDEKKHSIGQASKLDLRTSLLSTFRNKHFRYYVIADFSYFLGLTIVMTGLLYYITVLLELEESMMGMLLPFMVLISFFIYPMVNFLAKKTGKKIWISFGFFMMFVNFVTVYFLGNLPFTNIQQAWLLIVMMSIPIAFLGVLPNAVLGDIATYNSIKTGNNQEGMFFAARTLMQKFGQTFGVFIFAVLTTFGKDIGDDFGIRLSGLVGATFCIFAAIYFLKYNEKEVTSIAT